MVQTVSFILLTSLEFNKNTPKPKSSQIWQVILTNKIMLFAKYSLVQSETKYDVDVMCVAHCVW